MTENKTVVEGQVIDMETGEIEGTQGTGLVIKRDEVVTGISVDTVFANDGLQVLASFKQDSMKDKIKLLNAIQGEAKPLSEVVNVPFVLEDYVAHNVQFTDEETQAKTDGVRILLLDNEGNVYSGSGTGLHNSLQKIFAIFGQKDQWGDSRLKVKASTRVISKDKQTTILEVVDVIEG